MCKIIIIIPLTVQTTTHYSYKIHVLNAHVSHFIIGENLTDELFELGVGIKP